MTEGMGRYRISTKNGIGSQKVNECQHLIATEKIRHKNTY